MQTKTNLVKRIVDVVLTVLLLLIMAYQVTGESLHEWLGIAMTVIVIAHHILNYKWYKALFKGRYTLYRIVLTVNDVLLLAAFGITAACGMSMSSHAVPFMHGLVNVMTARKLHLAFSFWAFTIMGVHIGLHLRSITAKFKPNKAVKITALSLFAGVAAIGGRLFFKGDIPGYLTFRTHFAFLDYEKAKWLVIAENLAMLMFWAFAGYIISRLVQKHKSKAGILKPTAWFAAVAIAVIVMLFAFKDKQSDNSTSWQNTTPKATTQATDSSSEQKQTALTMRIGETKVDVQWEDNESVSALRELAKDKPLTVQMSKYGGFEQVGSLGRQLPSDDVQTHTEAGDIVLYSGSKIVVFYGSNSWEYTRLGRITDKSGAELAELLGNEDTTVTISNKRR